MNGKMDILSNRAGEKTKHGSCFSSCFSHSQSLISFLCSFLGLKGANMDWMADVPNVLQTSFGQCGVNSSPQTAEYKFYCL